MIKHATASRSAARTFFQTLNPATGEVIDEVASGGEAEIAGVEAPAALAARPPARARQT